MFITALSCYVSATVTSSLIRSTRGYFLGNHHSFFSFTFNDKEWSPKTPVSIACVNALVSPIVEPIILYSDIKQKDFKKTINITKEF